LTDAASQANAFLMIRFAGSGSAVSAQIARTRELAGLGKNSILLMEEDEAIWTALQALPIRFSDRLTWRAGLRPTEAASFLLELIKTLDSETMWHAGVADGRIRVIDASDAHDGDAEIHIEHLRKNAEDRGGTIIIESGNGGLNRAVFSKHSAVDLMNKVKQQLDPNNVFPFGR